MYTKPIIILKKDSYSKLIFFFQEKKGLSSSFSFLFFRAYAVCSFLPFPFSLFRFSFNLSAKYIFFLRINLRKTENGKNKRARARARKNRGHENGREGRIGFYKQLISFVHGANQSNWRIMHILR